MLSRTASTTTGVTRRNTDTFRVSVSRVPNHARQSQQQLAPFERSASSSNGRSRTVVRTTIRSANDRSRSAENKPDNSHVDSHQIVTVQPVRYHQNVIFNSDLLPDSFEPIPSSSLPFSTDTTTHKQRSPSELFCDTWYDNDAKKSAQERKNYSAKTIGFTMSDNGHSNGRISRQEKFMLETSANFTHHDANLPKKTNNKTIKNNDRFSNIKTFHRDSDNNKNNRKKNKYPCRLCCRCSCLCLVLSLLAALLLGIILAAVLLAILMKPKTTTTTTTATTSISTTSVGKTTTISTTTSSTTETTTTSIVCTTPNNTDLFFDSNSTTYTFVTYNYVAAFTGTAVLEFGFTGQTGNDYWYLDDVSLVDTNISNSEMLVNGGFENGTLDGWQLLCTSNCQSASPAGTITSTPCKTGSSCYADACKAGFDFLRQTFSATIGHVYTLSFWLQSAAKPQQHAFVRFF